MPGIFYVVDPRIDAKTFVFFEEVLKVLYLFYIVIVFVNNVNDKIEVKPENLKDSYGKRGKMDLTLATTHDGKPVQGSFSVAVTNTAAVKPDPENETNILTKLLLTSDLSGYVEKPNYYFLNNDRNLFLAQSLGIFFVFNFMCQSADRRHFIGKLHSNSYNSTSTFI